LPQTAEPEVSPSPASMKASVLNDVAETTSLESSSEAQTVVEPKESNSEESTDKPETSAAEVGNTPTEATEGKEPVEAMAAESTFDITPGEGTTSTPSVVEKAESNEEPQPEKAQEETSEKIPEKETETTKEEKEETEPAKGSSISTSEVGTLATSSDSIILNGPTEASSSVSESDGAEKPDEKKIVDEESVQSQAVPAESTQEAKAEQPEQEKQSDTPQPTKRLVKQLSFKGVDSLERSSPRVLPVPDSPEKGNIIMFCEKNKKLQFI